MNAKAPASPAGSEPAAPPWWRVGMVWLVLGGPATVVVAGLITAVLAVHGAEEVLTAPQPATTDAHTPAMQARNHAATPKKP